jgi:hypothetical protein
MTKQQTLANDTAHQQHLDRVAENLSQAAAHPHEALDQLAKGAVLEFDDVVYRAEGDKVLEIERDGGTLSFDIAEVRQTMTDSLMADDKRILDERWEAGFYPDDGSEQQLTSSERQQERDLEAAASAMENDQELGENLAHYGEDRNTDLIADLRNKGGESIQHNGAFYSLEGPNVLQRWKDGEVTQHDATDVQDGIAHRREKEFAAEGEQKLSPLQARAAQRAASSAEAGERIAAQRVEENTRKQAIA